MLVLMDLQMPEMDGYQATAKLRSDTRFATLPIIAMTAHATIEERQRCLAAGMNDHIAKPIDPGNLFETVGRFYARGGRRPGRCGRRSRPRSSVHRRTLMTRRRLPASIRRMGSSRVGDNRQLYLKLLGQFVEQQGPALEQIADALARKDNALAERLAHTLKGVAGQHRRHARAIHCRHVGTVDSRPRRAEGRRGRQRTGSPLN